MSLRPLLDILAKVEPAYFTALPLLVQVLTRLADALAAHVASSTQRAHFACNPAVTWRGMEDPLKMRLAVGVTYSFTGKRLCVRAGTSLCSLVHLSQRLPAQRVSLPCRPLPLLRHAKETTPKKPRRHLATVTPAQTLT